MKAVEPIVRSSLVLVVIATAGFQRTQAGDWPQFRGPAGAGVAAGDTPLPAEIGPDSGVLWKKPLGEGHSSPVVYGEAVYLTAFEDERLLTLALDRDTGERLWENAAPYDELESVHRIGSVATPTVATDGEVVVSLFGSSGLSCYAPDGTLLWRRRMGPFNNPFGAASSPVLAGNRVVMIQDHDTGAFLATFDKRTGEELWRVERPEFRRNYSTPVLWEVDGRTQIVTTGTAHAVGYDLGTGDRRWTLAGLCRTVSTTPVVGNDGLLYIAATGGGRAPNQPAFDKLVETADADGNGLLEKREMPKSRIRGFFGQFDRDNDGSLDRKEYESIRRIFELAQTAALAVRPGGTGNITGTHVDWTTSRGIPRNPSPLYYDGHLYLVRSGGVVTVLDAASGESVKQGRLSGQGRYFASPVTGDGKIYAVSEQGVLSVITAEPEWKRLASADFGEKVYATPALADGRVYLRTTDHLYCFGTQK